MSTKTGVVYHEDYLKHNTNTHPECKERLTVTMELLKKSGAFGNLVDITPKKATPEQIERVHSPSYVEDVRMRCRSGGGMLDADTVLSANSYDVSLLAAGGVMSAVDAVMGYLDNAFALIRPPGHHAFSDHGGGFCIFNSIAMGARCAQSRHDIER
ncbi:MAG: hypothetical protein LRZ87_01035, partial [Methanocellales archaeon]|nr:hypothetical protein [Methanocellales archaeon]